MKKSVNGKTFDEIFEQKGEIIETKDLFFNTVYLFVSENYKFIAELSHVDDIDGMLMLNDSICNDGEFDSDEGKMGLYADFIYVPTEAQISLLNLYKSESK